MEEGLARGSGEGLWRGFVRRAAGEAVAEATEGVESDFRVKGDASGFCNVAPS